RLGRERSHEDRTRHRSFGVRVRKPCAEWWNRRIEEKRGEDQRPGRAPRISSHIPEGKRTGLGPMHYDSCEQKQSAEYVNQEITETRCHSRCLAAQQYQKRGRNRHEFPEHIKRKEVPG